MTTTAAWTIAVADRVNPTNPTIAYVTAATGRADAIARVHHTGVYGWTADRILTVAADPGTPPADAWYGWTDLRGIKAIRVVLEPDQVRQVARLRLRLRRWTTMMAPHYAIEEATGQLIPPSAWHAYSDEAEAICQTLDQVLSGQVNA